MTAIAEPPANIQRMSKTTKPRVTAETLAAKQRDISVSEFFAKNRHLLGFDNPRKALLTTVKEAVDNSLDACEEAGILPDITVVIEDLSGGPVLRDGREANGKADKDGKGTPIATGSEPRVGKGKAPQSSRYRVTIIDNGPGIVRKQVEHIFGRLLYGSKFHRLKMSRGQQGIGISAAGMYGLITTGKPMVIHTKPKAHAPAHHIELAMNTKTNRAEVTVDTETDDFPLQRLRDLNKGTRDPAFMRDEDYRTGTSVSIELEGRYQKGRGSVDEFLELTAIANPHAKITFVPPVKESEPDEDEPLLKGRDKPGGVERESEGHGGAGVDSHTARAESSQPAAPVVTTESNGVIYFPRAVNELPPETKEIQPHPRGIELGILLQMLKESEGAGYTLYNFLQDKFCRVSAATASMLCERVGLTSRTRVADVDHAAAEKLFHELQTAKLPPPPTDCLAPIGVQQLLKGMFKGVRAEFYAASSRDAEIYRGRPFQIEAAIAFGGELPADDPARVIRFANRVPLLFQQSACSSFKAVVETGWKNYSLQQPRGSLPVGPLVIMIHMASVWVPFTSESKEAIADYDEIRKEMKLALMECGRKLGTYLRKRQRMRRESERRDIFERYIGEISKAVSAINGQDTKKLYDALLAQAKKRTAIADLELDDEGKRVKEEDISDQDGVLIVESEPGRPAPTSPFVQSKAEAAALKVAALAKDEEPMLLGVKQPTRSVRASKSPSKTTSVAQPQPEPHAKAGKKPEKPRAPISPPVVPAKPKPRMTLVNGKLVPKDEGGRLF